MRTTRRKLLVGSVGALGLLGRAALAADGAGLEERARAVEGELIAPCCFSQTVAHHSSPQAEQIKREIRAELAAGTSEREIVDAYLARYGERILAAPRARGFNALAYLGPPLFLAAGALVGLRWLLRHRAGGAGGVPRPVAPPASPDPERLAALRAELARPDGGV